MESRVTKPLVRFACALILLAIVAALWMAWTELHPQAERALRVELQDRLERSLPETVRPPWRQYGIFPLGRATGIRQPLGVLLVHGLDEPGTIWNDLAPALSAAGFDVWQFRYPNDQGIDRSADLLAASWPELPAQVPMALIGHSMGGLVIRDFVSRLRHPAGTPQSMGGAAVRSVILAGTPNQGSEWARLRFWLEPRDQWATAGEPGFSLLSGLRDGTGAAKIDLRPGSAFLQDLNARPWPDSVRVLIIGGLLMPSTPALGDGVVAIDSLPVDGAPPPIIVAGSHRGMLKRMFESDDEPPAIPLIIKLLESSGTGD